MIIILHILIALSSIILTSYVFLRPTRQALRLNYGLIGATLASGMYLVVSAPAHMLETCLMGITYLTIVSVGTAVARVKVAQIEAAKLD